MTERGTDQKEEGSKGKIFPVPFALGEIKGTISINTNVSSKPSKEQIINQAFKFHSQGNTPQAAKYYQYFIDKGFKDPRVFSNYGNILKDLGKLKEAEFYTRKAIEVKPDYADAHYNLGIILNDLGKLKEAELAYRKATDVKPDYAEAHYNLGVILNDLGKLKEAELAYRKAIEVKTDYAEAHSNLGIILKDLGKLKEAEFYTRKTIELKPDFAETHFNLGNILKSIGNLKEAEFYTRKAIELKPDFVIAHCNLGSIFKDLGKLKEAEFYIRKAIELKPDFAETHFNLGSIFKDLGKLKEAELSTRKAIEVKPDYSEAYYNLGIILNDLGKLKEAETSFSKSIELNPDNHSALLGRAQLFFDNEEFDKALRDTDSKKEEFDKASRDMKILRVFSLEILYKLGRVEEIYERIEKTSKLDELDIRLAAFSSFILAEEKKDIANNFCQNPLSFLYFSNINNHLKDCKTFIKEIISELNDIETVWEPRKNTTHNGFHTPTHINVFSNSSKYISQLKSIIFNELDSYYFKFENENCSYIKKWPSKKNLQAWHVILKKQGYQSAHIHPSGWLSGVIYLKVVPSLGNDEGAIEFSLNLPNFPNINSPKLIHPPEAGDIVFFPSSLHHRTIPFSTDTDRIVIAFDLMPN